MEVSQIAALSIRSHPLGLGGDGLWGQLPQQNGFLSTTYKQRSTALAAATGLNRSLTEGPPARRYPPRQLMRICRRLLCLALLVGFVALQPAAAQAWTWPGRPGSTDRHPVLRPGRSPVAARPAAPRPQEVAPPPAVQQLALALAARQPRVSILEPADGTLLAAGPWTLKLQVDDWPLVDAGRLGLGPHLMLQIDDARPEPLLQTTATLPALAAGSHRLTVYAVRPWGEVVKAPGAFAQIRLHRVVANPLSLPPPGTPQLLPVSPALVSAAEPLLLDWLLIDAPLQNLRADDARWRLRVTLNGDSFLVNQQTPLWLKGWKSGSNAVLMELVDGKGEPLNPPFNSLVREVRLDAAARRPAWLGPQLSQLDLARLLGEAPLEPEAVLPPEPEALASPEPEALILPEPAVVASPEAPEPAAVVAAEPEAVLPPGPEAATALAAPPPPSSEAIAAAAAQPGRAISPDSAASPPEPALQKPAAPTAVAMPPQPLEAGQQSPQLEPPPLESPPLEPRFPTSTPTPAPTPAAPSPTPQPSRPLRPAREEVNPDGTLMRPQRQGPIQALRERLGR